jgi:hypothetical protein
MIGVTKSEQGRRGRSPSIALLRWLPIAVVMQACGGDCTDMACSPGAEVIFSEALDDSATYVVDIVADGEATSCEVSPSGDHDCPGLQFFVTGSGSTVTDSGARLPNGGWAGLLIAGNPRELRVEIRQAEESVGSAEATLDYRGVEINGSGCGECRLATMNLSVSP